LGCTSTCVLIGSFFKSVLCAAGHPPLRKANHRLESVHGMKLVAFIMLFLRFQVMMKHAIDDGPHEAHGRMLLLRQEFAPFLQGSKHVNETAGHTLSAGPLTQNGQRDAVGICLRCGRCLRGDKYSTGEQDTPRWRSAISTGSLPQRRQIPTASCCPF